MPSNGHGDTLVIRHWNTIHVPVSQNEAVKPERLSQVMLSNGSEIEV